MFRNLWENIRKDMPKKGRGRAASSIRSSCPPACRRRCKRSTATTRRPSSCWEEAGIRVPPCFIIVCQNTAISKLVYDFISGFHRKNDDGTHHAENGRLALFRNFDETPATRCPRPNTLLIDSEQLEAGRRARRQLPRHGRRRDRALPPRDRRAHRRPRGRRQHHRPGAAARGHEHRRQARPARRLHPLRRLRLDAHRRLGRQHRHARPRRPRLRHSAPLRAGHRPRPAPPVVRAERRGPLQRRICRCLRHSLRLHRQAVIAPPQPPRETIQVKAVRPERDASGNPLPAR